MGPSINPPDSSNLQILRRRKTLEAAWAIVRENGLKSSSSKTIEDTKNYSSKSNTHLTRIQRQLRNNKFDFKPAAGVLVSKPGSNNKRPIVIAPIDTRIIQRALLDIIQGVPQIKDMLTAGYNYGGVKGSNFGVPPAVLKTHELTKTYPYFIRSDIKSFFTAVPRQYALEIINTYIDDPYFMDFLTLATKTELQDIEKFGDNYKLFPIFDEGVAQGSCLSPLLCNLLLHDFDYEMNQRGIRCVRYIDDFVILAKSKKYAHKALGNGLKILKDLGLDAYSPNAGSDKAKCGAVDKGFVFLGCEIRPDRIRPSKSNRRKFKSRIRELFQLSLNAGQSPKNAFTNHKTYSETLNLASNIVRGWGNTYSFCTDKRLMKSLDNELDEVFRRFNSKYKTLLKKQSNVDTRRLLGFCSLQDCKS